MSALDCLRWQNFSVAQEEATSTEGKAGVPRFDGEATRLSEYSFRVRLKQAREVSLPDDEKKKLGALGLRLIDGLRGPALQVARNLPIDKLSESDGPQYLLKQLQAALQPRRQQEARELYQVGAQLGGVLSRQQGESIPSYVLRIKAWYALMTDLDSELKLPEGILTEQLLQNAGITEDHKLLVRTAVGGEMKWEKVCEELVAQHSRIHEREARARFGGGKFSGGKFSGKHQSKGYGKPFGGGKGKPSWRTAYHADDLEAGQEAWEATSQSLSGFEEYDESYYGEEFDDEEDAVLSAF